MCDTFVILPGITADGSMLFGKNSNREPNEAQSLEHHPAGIHSPAEKVKCTYIEIPQVKETFGVLLSRPLQKECQTHWATGTSAPCLGVFKPIWIEGGVLPDIGPLPKGTFNPQTLWWQHERLHRGPC